MQRIAVVIAVVALGATAYYAAHEGVITWTHDRNAKLASRAPSVTLVDLSGNSIDTSSYKGNVVLVNFWAAWCTPCADEVPKLIALQDKYRAQGLRVVGISMDDSDTALRDFYRKYKMNYPVAAGDQKVVNAYGGILGLPTSLLISRDGIIHEKHVGLADSSRLEQEIIALLKAN